MRQRSLPPLTIAVIRPGESCRSVTVTGLFDGDRVADLAGGAGLAPADAYLIDDRVVVAQQRLVTSGVRRGSTLAPVTTPANAPPAGPALTTSCQVEWCAGPDAGRRVSLPAGRHLIGRNRGLSLGAQDPRLAVHHGLVTIDASGVGYRNLPAGSADIDGTPVDGTTSLTPGRWLRLGSSLVRVRTRWSPAVIEMPGSGRPTAGWVTPLIRPPRRLDNTGMAPVALPDPLAGGEEPRSGGAAPLITAGVSMVAGAAMVIVFHQLLMAIMVSIAALTAVVTWAVQAIRARRSRRRRARALADRAADVEGRLVVAHAAAAQYLGGRATLLDAVDACRSGVGLWERRPAHADAYKVTLGVGTVSWDPTLVADSGAPGHLFARDDATSAGLARLRAIDHVPIISRLEPGASLGLVGPRALVAALARSLVLQLAATVGPADLELALAAPAARLAEWSWMSWLPHARSTDAVQCGTAADVDAWLLSRLAAASAVGATTDVRTAERLLVVVVDEPAMLASRTSPLRRVAGAANAVATIVLGDDLEGLPSMCTEAFEIAEDAVAVRHRWSGFADGGIANRFRITGASRSTVDEAARLMARFDDPERADQLGDLPARVDLFDIAGEHLSSSAMIAAAWNDAGEDPRPRAMLGAAGDGLIEIDLERDGPHTLIGGTTGAGKSELLRTMVASLAIASPPEALSFVLIDYKGGAAFDACARLPHVVGVVTDLDGRLASRVLTSLEAELHRRELLLRECSASDLSAYRAGRPAEPLARLVVVVDEFAALAADLPTFLDSLVSIAQRGRSLGVHLVLATQRPNGVINDDIRANTNLRIALRVQDRADALDVVGDPLPATLSRTRPGSAVIRLDAGEVSAFQTARCTGPPPADSRQRRSDEASAHQVTGPVTALELLVDRLIGAAECRAVARPRRPWLDPLPAVARRSLADPGARSPSIDANRPGLTVSSPGPVGEGMWVDPPSFGAVDVPEAQRLDSLGWDHRSGHLIVAGSVGSGTSTALATVAVTLAATRSAGRLHLYVIDASGGGGLDVSSGGGLDISGGGGLDVLGGLPHCAGVIGLGDDHRRSRLLRRLADEIADRQVHRASGRPDVILVVDGYATLRASLDSAARQEDADRLAVITQDGPRVGVSLAVSLDRPSDAPLALSARASARWLFGLVDPLEAAAWGIPARDALPPGRPGRCLRVESGHEAQVFVDPRPLAEVVAAVGGSGGPAKLGDLPAVVTFDDLLARDRVNLIQTEALTTQHEVVDSRPNDGRPTSVRMPVGLSVATLEPVVIELHEGEHLLVAGPARSGRSSALALLTAAWRFTHTDGWVGAVRPRRSAALTGLDADLDGTLTDVVAAAGELGERPGLIVVDDAELVDTDGGLTALLARPHHSVQVIASGRPDALRAAYGHWTAVIRRSRKGLLLGAVHDLDADVLGVVLPRHRDPHVVVGRGWTVADGMIEPTQFARMTVPVRLVA